MVVLVGRGVSKRKYSKYDVKGVRENVGGVAVDRNSSRKVTAEVYEVQEGLVVQDQPGKGFNSYCTKKDGHRGDNV